MSNIFNSKNLFLLALPLFLLSAACSKKDDDDSPQPEPKAPTIEGNWRVDSTVVTANFMGQAQVISDASIGHRWIFDQGTATIQRSGMSQQATFQLLPNNRFVLSNRPDTATYSLNESTLRLHFLNMNQQLGFALEEQYYMSREQ